jgi:phage gp46-like protein
MISPNVTFSGDAGELESIKGIYEGRGMLNGRVFYLQQLENAMSETVKALALWYAEDRGQWVVTGADSIGDSTQVVARISSKAWWPWEAHACGNTSPALLGAAMLAALPPWHEGAALLSSLREKWQILDAMGKVSTPKDMQVECIHYKYAVVSAGEGAQHKFVGNYEYAGMLSSRPFFLQTQKNKRKPTRFALWYAEEAERWVITNDFRLLDGTVVDARAEDSSWFPWDVACPWEVADGQGDFVADILLKVAFREESPKKKKKQPGDAPSVVSDDASGTGTYETHEEDDDDERSSKDGKQADAETPEQPVAEQSVTEPSPSVEEIADMHLATMFT